MGDPRSTQNKEGSFQEIEYLKGRAEWHTKMQRGAKKMVAKVRHERYHKVYKNMTTKEGQEDEFWIAKQRDKASKNVQAVKIMKNEHGKVITSEKEVKERWGKYFN